MNLRLISTRRQKKKARTGWVRAFCYLLREGLRQGSAEVGVAALSGDADDEHHVIAGLQRGHDAAVAALVGDRAAVDRGDDQALAEVDVLGEGAGTYIGDDDAARDAHLLGGRWRQRGDGDAELALARIGLLRRVVVVSIGGGERRELAAVADGDRGGLLLAVAQVAELDDAADLAGGDVFDQVVAVLDRAAVDGDDDVAGLEASLGGAGRWGRRC